MEFGAGTVTSAMSTLGCVIGLRRERSCGPSQGYPGPHPSPDDRQHSQRVCSLPPRDATLPIQLDIDSSKVDVRSPTIGPWRPRSPEMRGTEECRGRPSWVRTTRWSHFSEEAVFQQRQDGGVEAKKQPPGTIRRWVMAIPCLSVAVTMGWL